MSAAALLRLMKADGVQLSITPAGTIKAAGNQEAISRWVPVLREKKMEILNALANQIRILDSLFSCNVIRAHNTERMNLLKIYSNIAFMAQRQCRTTIETLAEIKNPQPYIQNNRAQYQQVNNGQPVPANNYPTNTRGRWRKSKNDERTINKREQRL